MALIKCKDCQTEVSTDAKQCPKCGGPIKKAGTGFLAMIVYGFIGMFVLSIAISAYQTLSGKTAEEEAKHQQKMEALAAEQAEKRKKDVKDAIAKKSVFIGMTADEVRKSWGKPEKVNTTVSANRRSEQWVYPGTYLYFDDGILRSTQQSN